MNEDRPQVILECAGPSGCGKSTLIEQLAARITVPFLAVHTGKNLGNDQLPEYLSDLEQQNWKADVHLFPWFLVFVVRHFPFAMFCLNNIARAPERFGHRVAIFRSFIRKAGLNIYLKRRKFRGNIVLIDEGIVQSAHNFLVFPSGEVSEHAVRSFAAAVPHADLIVMFNQDPEQTKRQLQRRGNLSPRLNGERDIQPFVDNAVRVFELMSMDTGIRNSTIFLSQVTAESTELVYERLQKINTQKT